MTTTKKPATVKAPSRRRAATRATSKGQAASPRKQSARKRSAPKSKAAQTLKRTGEKPLVFDGEMVLAATSFRNGPSLWYELTLFKVRTGGFVVSITSYKKSDKENDTHRVSLHETFDEVMDHIETYDPALDVDAALMTSAMGESGAHIALHTLMTRHKIEEAIAEYRSLSGEVLFQLANDGLQAA